MNILFHPLKVYSEVRIISSRRLYFLEQKAFQWMKLLEFPTGRLVIELDWYRQGVELSIVYGMHCLQKETFPSSYYFWGDVDLLGNIKYAPYPRSMTFHDDKPWVVASEIKWFNVPTKQINHVKDLYRLREISSISPSQTLVLTERLPELLARRLLDFMNNPREQLILPREFSSYKTTCTKLIKLVLKMEPCIVWSRERIRGSAGEFTIHELLKILKLDSLAIKV